jgi:hypothetical protein
MAADQQEVSLRAELRLVEEELAELRRAAAEIRKQIGERSEAPTDSAEISALITTAEEQEALAKILEARRDELKERLGAR